MAKLLVTHEDICQSISVFVQVIKQFESELQQVDSQDEMKVIHVLSNMFSIFEKEISGKMKIILSEHQSLLSKKNEPQEDGVKLIDSIVRLLTLFNHIESDEQHFILSIGDSLIVQTCLTRLMSLAVLPHLRKDFAQLDQLIQANIKWEIKYQLLDNQQLMHLCQLIMDIILSRSIISNLVIQHCLAIMIALLLSFQKISPPIDSAPLLSSFLTKIDQVLIMRNLLLLLRCKSLPDEWAKLEISYHLSSLIIEEKGVEHLITAVIDPDETSQRQTTHHQRYLAIATVIVGLPKLCCPLEEFYASLSGQLVGLLSSDDETNWRTSASIVVALNRRSSKLTKQYILDDIVKVIQTEESRFTQMTIQSSVEILHRLVMTRFNVKQLVKQYKYLSCHLFYLRIALDQTLSPIKKKLDEILDEIFSSIQHSLYLLDYIVFDHQEKMNLYEIKVDNENGNIIVEKAPSQTSSDQELSIKQVDSIVQVVMSFTSKLSTSFRVDLFLLLLERMTFSPPSLLTCSLVSTLNEEVSSLIIQHTDKAIRFIVTTLQRISTQSSKVSVNVGEEEEELDLEDALNHMQTDSLLICLQIADIIIKEREKKTINMTPKEITQLKQCVNSLSLISRNENFNDETREKARDLMRQIELMDLKESVIFSGEENGKEFREAIIELNDGIMPVRAHALIRLRRLIDGKDEELMKNKVQLINALKMCLADPESYIYLSAINTLSSLALVSTQDVLPILTDLFNDSSRPIQERLNVGQVLVQISKCIGDLAHYYSKQFIHCFLLGTKSEEAAIRISSLSNLGQFSGVLKYALGPYIVEMMMCVDSLLKTDPNLEVKRACVMLIELMLAGIDISMISVIQDQLKQIYKLLLLIRDSTLDDVLERHAQLAIQHIDRIAKEIFIPKDQNVLRKKIEVLNL